jgi:two-component system nitrogen regulation sensor histidine kinase NtrY
MLRNSRYSLVITIRVILITLNCFALVWLITQTNRPATSLFAFMLLIIQIYSLVYYHNRINRDLANFLIFLQENDTMLAFSKQRIERSFKGLTYHLDMINQKLQTARIDRERQFHYLQSVVKQLDTGIIAFDQEGNVELFNQAARELLGIHSLNNINRLYELCPELTGLFSSGDRTSSPLKIKVNGNERMLSIKSGSILFDNRAVQLISFQNIRPELEAGELEAWRKLIRIQRHEIINSITPITTLTTAIKRCFIKNKTRKNLNDITDEHIEDALKSVEVIEERSMGLIDFVERFRSLTDVPVLKITSFQFKKLVDSIVILLFKDLQDRKISLKIEVIPENFKLTADEKLMEQVIINLIKNSIEAIIPPGGVINIKAYSIPQNCCVIQVLDNGTGIKEDAIESIFVPSYTTKENGSGIGLSISRQIVLMHHGTISVRSEPCVETAFEIVLPE